MATLTDLERSTIRNAAFGCSLETEALIKIIEKLSGEKFLDEEERVPDGTDGSGNEYELLSSEEENLIIYGNPDASPPEGLIDASGDSSIELKEWSINDPADEDDLVTSLLETRAKNLSYAFAHNPRVLSAKLKESLISLAGPQASKAYHISAYYDGKDINFNISRLSPRSIIKIETDFKTVDIGAKYYNTVNGWVVSAGLSVSAGLGFNSPDDSDVKASFSITMSR